MEWGASRGLSCHACRVIQADCVRLMHLWMMDLVDWAGICQWNADPRRSAALSSWHLNSHVWICVGIPARRKIEAT